MKAAVRMTKIQKQMQTSSPKAVDQTKIKMLIKQSWGKIAPTWPLKNLIAVNPLAGFENLSFEEALREGQAYFQAPDLPETMQDVNRQSIKWLQGFFDDGQSTIHMPLRHRGLYASVTALLPLDKNAAPKTEQAKSFVQNLPKDPTTAIAQCLLFLGIHTEKQAEFLTLMLSTLPGWAAYIKYRTDWPDAADAAHQNPVTQEDYLALRLVLACLIWPEAKTLLDWHRAAHEKADNETDLKKIKQDEQVYRTNLLNALKPKIQSEKTKPDAQLVFCIDVRSEPFRRAMEAQGDYETFGFVGFFGVPVSIQNAITGENHASCPVLLKPAYTVSENPTCDHSVCQKSHDRNKGIKSLYQSLKYTFTTPFTLVEALGPFSGALMGMRSFLPALQKPQAPLDTHLDISAIPFAEQVNFASGALRMMGLTDNFAPLVVFCGHSSETKNNAYATALDCGACGGHHGAPNAKILATILNDSKVRKTIAKKNIVIPNKTHFMAAQHNTTTDEVTLYQTPASENYAEQVKALQVDLQKSRAKNSLWRAGEMGQKLDNKKAANHTAARASDWAQVRPEWGLARNAAFIIGPRALTKNFNLEGRSFLHSYDYKVDEDGSALTVILTAPMVVAQWINSQYFFSTYDNVAYGGGSKISKNITGKIGIMQSNASDLMHGLPLQSVNKSDGEAYHKPLRLMTIVYAPRVMIDQIIKEQEVLQKLFGNGWVTLACIEPETGEKFILGRNLKWQKQQ